MLTDPESKSLSDGLLQDTADRLRGVRDDRRKLTVIPPRDAVRNKVDAPEKAASLLGATHTLTGTLRSDNGRVTVHAVLGDARSRVPLKEWDADYQPGALAELPMALAGIVTGALRLPPLAREATVNAAAYPAFTAGVGLLQRDSGVDAALPLLERAVAADPDSPLTLRAAGGSAGTQVPAEPCIEWLDRADAVSARGSEAQSGSPPCVAGIRKDQRIRRILRSGGIGPRTRPADRSPGWRRVAAPRPGLSGK